MKTIFAYWQRIMDSPKSVLDDKRKRLIAKALKGYSPADTAALRKGHDRYEVTYPSEKTA